ncbi:MAG: SsrA-binding protein SmpB [Syntrophobacteraceae bacterium]|nr:SsrA-binding protein SmpB [Syntrophobacteraceae bacterium]
MPKADSQTERIKLIAQNKKAYHDFEIGDKFEAGIVLLGTEVKSLREGRANLKDSYARVKRNEVFLFGLHISPYSHASYENHEPERVRKLLLHRAEIKKLVGKTQERGYSLVPLKVYFKEGKAKVEIALARGKKEYDKRESLKRKEGVREMDRLKKSRNYS